MIPYTYPMSKYLSDFVVKIAQTCQSEDVCTGHICRACSGSTIRIGKQEFAIPDNNEYDEAMALTQLGFIGSIPDIAKTKTAGDLPVGEYIVVLDDLFKWADYLKKNRLCRWFIRTFPNVKDILLGVSFTASLVLIAIQIIQAFNH